jgi:hypothetical protein
MMPPAKSAGTLIFLPAYRRVPIQVVAKEVSRMKFERSIEIRSGTCP